MIMLCQEAKNKKVHLNLDKSGCVALESLKANNETVIREADKCGGIVILDKTSYIEEAMRILSDSQTYSWLPQDPLPTFKKEPWKY